MDRSTPAFTFATKDYCLLTKPGIIFGNAVTTAAGFVLASKGHTNIWLFLETLLGLCLIIASGCVLNNYLDRHIDKKMARTRQRGLVKGTISTQGALFFAALLGLLGTAVLSLFTNALAVSIALFGLFVYVVLYTLSKYRSIHGTLMGSVAGAIPPVVGYCAVTNHFDLTALALFTIIVLWQMPHFFAIAIYRLKDYNAASIPVLPLKKGMRTTKIQMLGYIIAFIGASFTLVALHDVGYLYLTVATLLGTSWLALCIQGFRCDSDMRWARNMFRFSLVVIMGLCISIPFSL